MPNKFKTNIALSLLSLGLAVGLGYAFHINSELDETNLALILKIHRTELKRHEAQIELESVQRELEVTKAELVDANDVLSQIRLALDISHTSHSSRLDDLQNLRHLVKQMSADLDAALSDIIDKQNTIDEITAVSIDYRDRIYAASEAISSGLAWVKVIPRSSFFSSSFAFSDDPYEKLRVKYNNLVVEHNDLVDRFNAAVERSNDLSGIINNVSDALSY